ncbi:MAG: NFACT RNA binding domain-containing protein [Lachnospiraceae bacterium]|nr:NFACT RNA binding domain-containing protein [Lachnospiraceae bacterium]
MAFDGITTAAIVHELKDTIEGGGISRIIQPEKDELQLVIKNRKEQYILLMSANASLPLIYLTEAKKEAPMTAPAFSMLLRKHLQGGQITSVTQPSLERVVVLEVLHRDELGDLRTKKLIIELMGKYSNIIFTDESDTVIDAIRRIPASVSSVREVLPGRQYFIPRTREKADPLTADAGTFSAVMSAASSDVVKALYESYTGISPSAAEEMIYEAGADGRCGFSDLPDDQKQALSMIFLSRMKDIREGRFSPNIVSRGGEPVEFGVFPYLMYAHEPYEARTCGSVSGMIISYYGAKERTSRIRQKSSDLRRVVATALDRTNRKFQIQEKQMQSTEKRDRYRIYGEMLHTYGYNAPEGAKELTCVNYYTDEPITIPLDPTMSASENAAKYFARYNKLKRTAEALTEQIEETKNDRDQLAACLTAIDMAETESDLGDIRRELSDFGFIRKKDPDRKGARRPAKSAPYMYISSDGFTMLVGKNNYQNEELSFKIADGNDWWFHAKGAPGSHVIVKTGGRELTDRAYEEAGALAAYYSSERRAPKVEIDYTRRRNLKKKNGGKPGFVIYHTNYSLMAIPDISGLKRI